MSFGIGNRVLQGEPSITIHGVTESTKITQELFEKVGKEGARALSNEAIDTNVWPTLDIVKKDALRSAVNSGELVMSSELSTESRDLVQEVNTRIHDEQSIKVITGGLSFATLTVLIGTFIGHMISNDGGMALTVKQVLGDSLIYAELSSLTIWGLPFIAASVIENQDKKELQNKASVLKFFEKI